MTGNALGGTFQSVVMHIGSRSLMQLDVERRRLLPIATPAGAPLGRPVGKESPIPALLKP